MRWAQDVGSAHAGAAAQHGCRAGTAVELCIAIHLWVAALQVKTDVVKGSLAPKFLKDCRLAVPTPESDYLRVRRAVNTRLTA